ncbi:hypothetical protein SAMN05661010_00644 [Modicisalibacter muralis]|uniref:Uncharacterized protein n=1 Tax=Modicisalibacter muralis TaxID=119000 RepID=A0A1G9GAH0_9GAMM|nr:hypothetical protein [Halomonas muralis]SDK97561.1 hypothetical protein SAMN05661010_00644 [Halomonas muralis]
MSERYVVVNVFDEHDENKVTGWKIIDTHDDNRVVSTHASQGEAQRQAGDLEIRHGRD